MILLQFVCDSTVRNLRTFAFPTCQYHSRNMYYVQQIFQDIRIEFMTTEGLHIPVEDRKTPTKVVLNFPKSDKW